MCYKQVLGLSGLARAHNLSLKQASLMLHCLQASISRAGQN